MARLHRLLATMLAAGLLAGAALVGAAPAGASALPIGQCTTTSGAILAVDFGHWGGPLLRACGSTPTTGYTLLNQGGWSSDGTVSFPTFVCNIHYSGYQGGAGFPASGVCGHTPTAANSWSYWHAGPTDPGWTFSQDGAADYSPAPGSVDLWTFGQGSPGYSPATVRATNTAPGGSGPAPSHSSTPARTSSAAGGGSGTGAGSGAAIGPARGSTIAGTPTSSTGTGTDRGMHRGPPASTATGRASAGLSASPPSTAAAGASSSPSVVDAAPVAAVRHRASSIRPVLTAAVLVLVLAAGSVLIAVRRRRAS